jgi:hypothetical protein
MAGRETMNAYLDALVQRGDSRARCGCVEPVERIGVALGDRCAEPIGIGLVALVEARQHRAIRSRSRGETRGGAASYQA